MEQTETKVEPKTGFLEESAGVKSSTRLISIIFAGYAVVFPTIIYFNGGTLSDSLLAFATIASFALGGKLIQKPMENKLN